jgi:hypothetical protein
MFAPFIAALPTVWNGYLWRKAAVRRHRYREEVLPELCTFRPMLGALTRDRKPLKKLFGSLLLSVGSTINGTVPEAPVGHRQPRASDVPNNEKNLSSDPISKEDAILDKKMKSICRGC